MGNRHIEFGILKSNEIITFEKKVCVFYPGVFSFKTFKLFDEDKEVLKNLNEMEEFFIYVNDC